MEGYKHILLPIDGSECSERAVAQAVVFQEKFGAKVSLLYVASDPDFDVAMGTPRVMIEDMNHECAEAEKYLRARQERFSGEVELLVKIGSVAKTIIEEAEHGDYDLIVMGSQGLGSPLRRFFIGSVAKTVLTESSQAVLIVR